MSRMSPATFIAGMIMVGVALIMLWVYVAGHTDVGWLRVGAPLFLVLVGVLGLALSRRRS